MARRPTVARQPDVALIARGLSYPGIDPRTWASLAVIDGVGIDEDEGIFADVTLLPSMIQETARVPGSWASGDGVNIPFEVGDEVLVTAPSGDPAAGLVITARMYSPSDKPSQLTIDNPDSITVSSGKNTIVELHGGATLIVQSKQLEGESELPGKIHVIGKDITVTGDAIHLGGDTGLKKVARKDDPISAGSFAVTVGSVPGAITLIFTYTPPGGAPVSQIVTLGGAVTGAVVGVPAALTGVISDGSNVVSAK